MKRLLLLLVVFIIGATGAFALGFDILSYPPPVSGGNILADVGIGSTGAEYGDISIPPLRVSAEYALPVGLPISVGGLLAFYRTEHNDLRGTYDYTYFTFGARANWHWGLNLPWLDLYTGLFLGCTLWSVDVPSGVPAGDGGGGDFDIGLQLGAHFYFTDLLGAFVEFGYPFYASVGLALKF
jgi:hypothetical protein